MGACEPPDPACPHCHQASTEHDAEQGLQVCSNCGYVLESVDLRSRVEVVDGQAAGWRVRDNDSGIIAGAQTSGFRGAFKKDKGSRAAPLETVRRLEAYGGALGVRKAEVEQAKFLLQQAVQQPEEAGLRSIPLDTLAAVCLYITCRLACLPVTLHQAAQLVQCDACVFGGPYKLVVAALGISLPTKSLTAFIPRAIRGLPGMSLDARLLAAWEQDALNLWSWLRTVPALDWLSMTSIAAVILLAADAHKVEVDKRELCAALGISTSGVGQRVFTFCKEIVQVLRQLPWLKTVSPKHTSQYLPTLFTLAAVSMKAAQPATRDTTPQPCTGAGTKPDDLAPEAVPALACASPSEPEQPCQQQQEPACSPVSRKRKQQEPHSAACDGPGSTAVRPTLRRSSRGCSGVQSSM